MSLRDQILAVDDLPREAVACPEWGNPAVFIRTMTAAERDGFEEEIYSADFTTRNLANVRAKLVARTLVDGDGNRVFQGGDETALGAKSSVVLDRLFEVAQRLNALRKTDVEELAKNSAPGPSDASSLNSPQPSVAPSAS